MIVNCKNCDSSYKAITGNEEKVCRFCGLPIDFSSISESSDIYKDISNEHHGVVRKRVGFLFSSIFLSSIFQYSIATPAGMILHKISGIGFLWTTFIMHLFLIVALIKMRKALWGKVKFSKIKRIIYFSYVFIFYTLIGLLSLGFPPREFRANYIMIIQLGISIFIFWAVIETLVWFSMLKLNTKTKSNT